MQHRCGGSVLIAIGQHCFKPQMSMRTSAVHFDALRAALFRQLQNFEVSPEII
jgi:hypothetical protein